MSLGQAGLGFLMIVASAFLYWRNRLPTVRVVLVIIGIFLVGFTGWIIHTLAHVMALLVSLFGLFAAKWIGVGGGVILAGLVLWMCLHVGHDLLPKNKPAKSTYWVAVALSILIVAGLTPFAALNGLPAQVQTGISSTQGG